MATLATDLAPDLEIDSATGPVVGLTRVRHQIRDHEPRNFAKRLDAVLQLQYRINDANEYEFAYRIAAQPAADGGSLRQRIEQTNWSAFQARKPFVSNLDIEIPGHDTLVQVETFGSHFSWSLLTDAVTMLEDRSDLYGELRYFDGHDWVRREDFTRKTCQLIRFKAKFNAAAAARENHKFSYNVVLRDPARSTVEYEIDPDIKNPST